MNGSITLETRGPARANTVNGSVRARMGSTKGSHSLRFRTVNGSVTLTLPDDANAKIAAKNMNGRIETEFPLYVKHSRWGLGNRLDGSIGEGGPTIELETVNGAIHLLRDDSL